MIKKLFGKIRSRHRWHRATRIGIRPYTDFNGRVDDVVAILWPTRFNRLSVRIGRTRELATLRMIDKDLYGVDLRDDDDRSFL